MESRVLICHFSGGLWVALSRPIVFPRGEDRTCIFNTNQFALRLLKVTDKHAMPDVNHHIPILLPIRWWKVDNGPNGKVASRGSFNNLCARHILFYMEFIWMLAQLLNHVIGISIQIDTIDGMQGFIDRCSAHSLTCHCLFYSNCVIGNPLSNGLWGRSGS